MSKCISGTGSVWFQRIISLNAKSRGCHVITDEIINGFPEIKNIKIGLMHLCSKTLALMFMLCEL